MRSQKLGRSLQRRVVACYLLFCLVAVAWLAAGVLSTAQTILNGQAADACLTRLGQLASAVEIDQLRNDGAGLQPAVEQAQRDGGLRYCCVVGTDNRYLAHTTRPLVGAAAVEPTGKRFRWGNIDGVQYVDVKSRLLNEYRVDLTANSQRIGSLRLAVLEPTLWSVATEILRRAPLNLLLPLGCVGVGALVLGRMSKPAALIDDLLAQVARTPRDQPLRLEATPPRSAAAAGWNRLVQQVKDLESGRGASSVEDRLAVALADRRDGASRQLLDSLGDGIVVTDAEGRLELANAAIASLLGDDLPGDETTAAYLDQLTASGQDPAGATAAAAGRPLIAEVPAAGPGERTLRVERQPRGGDAANGHVWSVRDVTQQKLALQSRDEFINAATHELRTPLANIKAYAETLATCDFSDTEQQKGFCNTINAEATRLARFVDDLLDMSSLEVGSLAAKRQNVDVERLLHEASDKVKPLMAGRSLRFEAAIGPKLGEMRLDKDKVSAMVVNLLGNAAKYTPEGGDVTLTATTAGGHVTIEVSDTGVGISEEELPRVFEKFFRSENPAVAAETGTGLGLPLAREIARLHGGDLTARSELGAGSTFTVTLPRGRGDAA